MKSKLIFVALAAFLLGAVVYSAADARPASGNITWPVSLISNPCGAINYQYPSGGPARLSCIGVAGRSASINVPTPWLQDRAPEMSLVSIPTFFALSWDSSSVGAQDSAPLTMSYPIGNPSDRLIDVRVQLRLRSLPAQGSVSESVFISENVKIETSDNLFLMASDEDGNVDGEEMFANLACTAGTQSNQNALLLIDQSYGGYGSGDACNFIAGRLAKPSTVTFSDYKTGYQDTARYLDWPVLSPNYLVAFSPYASNFGSGSDRGSPAFKMAATTRFAVEARVVWDRHLEKLERPVTDCQWSYYDDYDFIDWGRWPDPIFCKRELIVEWPEFCKPFAGNCPYGHPDNWWVPFIPTVQAEALRRPDGSYSTTYEFVSVQSQALLSSP